eukprot:3314525-Rhodomonas_salina.2
MFFLVKKLTKNLAVDPKDYGPNLTETIKRKLVAEVRSPKLSMLPSSVGPFADLIATAPGHTRRPVLNLVPISMEAGSSFSKRAHLISLSACACRWRTRAQSGMASF